MSAAALLVVGPYRPPVVVEVELPDEFAWERLLAQVAVRAALDALPDPAGGLLVHRGRGGSAGVWSPRRSRPLAGAGAVALPEPVDHELPPLAPTRPVWVGRRP